MLFDIIQIVNFGDISMFVHGIHTKFQGVKHSFLIIKQKAFEAYMIISVKIHFKTGPQSSESGNRLRTEISKPHDGRVTVEL